MESFPLFSSLPAELRHQIYLLATPPRIVEVDSVEEEEEEFWERWTTDHTAGLHVHPDITYYLRLWTRADIGNSRKWRKQSTLTSYGFSTERSRHGHWPAEEHFPFEAILSEKKRTVYSMFRNCELYSRAQIPALLHTCADSRAALMAMGYELAFSTRTHDARTWFNFRTDVLHISADMEIFYGSFLGYSNSDMPIGQFRPRDLGRIRHLVFPRYIKPDFSRTQTDRILDLCYLMPNLEQIYLDADAWDPDEYPYPDDPRKLLKPYLKAVTRLPQIPSSDSLHMMAYEDVDLLWTSPWHRALELPDDLYYDEVSMDTWLMIWREAHGHGSSFISAFEARMQALLQERIEQQPQTPTKQDLACGRKLTMRNAPCIRAVHVLPISDLEQIYYLRQSLFLYIKATRESLADLEQGEGPESPHHPVTLGRAPLSWSETLRTGMSPLGHRPDWETRFQWWARKRLPNLRYPGFEVFP